MSYTTVASVKTSLGISGATQDTLLAQLIADADIYLNKALNIDSFDTADATEKLKFLPQQYSTQGYVYLPLKNFNVTVIKEINGKTYTGVLDTDYQIQEGRVLMIRDLHKYFVPTYFNYVNVKYTYGYARTQGADKLPGDVELLARLLVVGLYNEKYPMGYSLTTNGQPNMQGVSAYRLGEESINRGGALSVLGGIVSWKTEAERGMFKQLFMKYKKTENVIR